MVISFTKMHGAGNDFVMLDDRTGQIPWADHFKMAALATRRTGIGCEGVILIQPSDKADFRMRFLNPDGTEVDMCGNGARCAAWFAHAIGAAKTAMTMETMCGLVDAEIIDEGMVRVWMPEPGRKQYGMTLDVDGTTVTGDFIVAGVPHFVVQVASVASVDVVKLGRALRMHDAFAPDGTNVDFVTYRAANRMTMRTYERGVEAESGACGTGAVACAIVGVERFDKSLPARIKTSSGFDLTVDGDWRHKKCTGLTLTGPVKRVYVGELDLDDLEIGEEME